MIPTLKDTVHPDIDIDVVMEVIATIDNGWATWGDHENVIGWRPLTEWTKHTDRAWTSKATGFQVITDDGLYEFDLEGVGMVSSALWEPGITEETP